MYSNCHEEKVSFHFSPSLTDTCIYSKDHGIIGQCRFHFSQALERWTNLAYRMITSCALGSGAEDRPKSQVINHSLIYYLYSWSVNSRDPLESWFQPLLIRGVLDHHMDLLVRLKTRRGILTPKTVMNLSKQAKDFILSLTSKASCRVPSSETLLTIAIMDEDFFPKLTCSVLQFSAS